MKENYSRIGFRLHSREKIEITDMQYILERIFNIKFLSFQGDANEIDETLSAYCMGLIITLIKVMNNSDVHNYYYIFSGAMRDDIDEGDNDFNGYIDISDFILGILTIMDSHKWYKPTKEEIYGLE